MASEEVDASGKVHIARYAPVQYVAKRNVMPRFAPTVSSSASFLGNSFLVTRVCRKARPRLFPENYPPDCRQIRK